MADGIAVVTGASSGIGAATARRLAGGRSGLIAVAFSLSDTLPVALTDVDYFSQAIHAATERALQRDYALVVAPPTPPVPKVTLPGLALA